MATSEEILNDLLVVTDDQGQAIRGLIQAVESLRGLVADGLAIRQLPEIPPPVVDTEGIRAAVELVKLDPAELAAALAPIVEQVGTDDELQTVVRSLAEAISDLRTDVKNAAMSRSMRVTGSSTFRIKDSNDSFVDPATEETLRDIKRAISDFETRLDYDGRSDANPVYVGKAAQGTATSSASWTIQKMTYDSNARLTRAEVATGSWDNRTGLF